jgi:exodeoxyribonuclease III
MVSSLSGLGRPWNPFPGECGLVARFAAHGDGHPHEKGDQDGAAWKMKTTMSLAACRAWPLGGLHRACRSGCSARFLNRPPGCSAKLPKSQPRYERESHPRPKPDRLPDRQAADLRLLSWNVNGLRSVLGKGFLEWLAADGPDVLALQETRLKPEQLPSSAAGTLAALGYQVHWSQARRPGYSGTATLTRGGADGACSGLGAFDPALAHWDDEGRVTATRHGDLLLFNVYFPNGTSGPERLAYKLEFYEVFQRLMEDLQLKGERILVCGDLNTAHREIDLARPRENRETSGFLPQECAWIDRFLAGRRAAGFVDSFRHLHPEAAARYSWWSFRSGARQRNVGWRLDYVFIDRALLPRLAGAAIHDRVTGSDHCPVELRIRRSPR